MYPLLNIHLINFIKPIYNLKGAMDSHQQKPLTQTNPKKDEKPSLETYKEDFLKTIDAKEEYILYNLDRIREYVLSEFKEKKEKAAEDLNNLKLSSTEADIKNEILNVTLPFTDFTRHMQDKLSNVLHTKQYFLNVTTDMINSAKLTEEETKIAKENFNIVCNYKKRRENNLSCEDLYNEALVKYLVAKTFKKSATDTYNLASCFPVQKYFPNKEVLKVACIGGGPGSDLSGLLNYLIECGYSNFECVVYDYNATNWSNVCLAPLTDILQKQALKVFKKQIKLTLKWEFVDMKKDWTEKGYVPKADLFSTCWALNECLFNETFWNDLIQGNPESFFFFVDGESDPIERFQWLSSVSKRKFIYEALENPRRFAIFPLKE